MADGTNNQEIRDLKIELNALEVAYGKLEDKTNEIKKRSDAHSEAIKGKLTDEEMDLLDKQLDKIEADRTEVRKDKRLNLKRQNEIGDRLNELGPIHEVPTKTIVAQGSDSSTAEAKQFQQGFQIPFPDGTQMQVNAPATPANPAEDEKLRQKLAERQAILEQRQKELAVRNNQAPTIPSLTIAQETPAANTLYPSMTPGAKELPPLVRLDQQPLKLSEKLYPVMAYKENVYEAWPEEAIAQATKRYPELPRQIEESRQLVPDHPDDLLDPDYFEEPENPTFKDLYRAGVWKQKKQGKL
jgi:hypothetical protein